MKQSVFCKEGSWYKGNLHTHSTESDGKQTPEERFEAYKNHGYSFLALTDHNVYGAYPQYCTKDFLILPGTERDAFNPAEGRHHCLHTLGIAEHAETEPVCKQLARYASENPELPWQDLIDEIIEQGQLPIIAHPVWSRMSIEELRDLHGHIGVEIYNNTCEKRWHTGYADYIIDYCMRQGKKTLLFATDDAHSDDSLDMFGGWIQVKAKELTHEEIISQIKAGSFYSSMGPEIYDFGVEDGKVYIECSPCEEIHFVAYEPLGRSIFLHDVTSAEYTLSGKETYVRCECIDKNGKRAFTNPIFF